MPDLKWISTKEGLPEDGKSVPIRYRRFGELRMSMAYRENGKWYWRMPGSPVAVRYDVEYWMIVPPLYEESTDNESILSKKMNTSSPREKGGWHIGQKVRIKSRLDVGVCAIDRFTNNGVFVKATERVFFAHLAMSELEKVED